MANRGCSVFKRVSLLAAQADTILQSRHSPFDGFPKKRIVSILRFIHACRRVNLTKCLHLTKIRETLTPLTFPPAGHSHQEQKPRLTGRGLKLLLNFQRGLKMRHRLFQLRHFPINASQAGMNKSLIFVIGVILDQFQGLDKTGRSFGELTIFLKCKTQTF